MEHHRATHSLPTPPGTKPTALLAGGLAALLASACCLGPLILMVLGFSGAWIGNLTLLEPYRPFFIGVALVALFQAGQQIYRPARACTTGEVCAIPRVRNLYRIAFWLVGGLTLLALLYPSVLAWLYWIY